MAGEKSKIPEKDSEKEREKTNILEKVKEKYDRRREKTDILKKGGGKSDRLEKEREN